MREKETTRIVITSYQCRLGSYDVSEQFRLIRHPNTGEVMSEELTGVTVGSDGWMSRRQAEELAVCIASGGPYPQWFEEAKLSVDGLCLSE